MNAKHVISKKQYLGIALAIHLATLGFSSAYGWSISGIVKNTSGEALAGVNITVKDSANSSTTTDETGAFLLEHETSAKPIINSVKSNSLSAQLVKGELLIKSSFDGAMELSLVNCAGQTLWATKTVSKRGVARVAFPNKLGTGITFLQIKNSKGVEYHAMGCGANGIHIKSSQLTAKNSISANVIAENFPTILFQKNDYHDTSFSMTSEKMSNVNIVMAKNEKNCPLPTNLQWIDSGMIADIKPDGNHRIVSVKDPTIQKYNGKYLIYCTVYNTSANTWSMQFIQFEKFSDAKNQTPFFMDQVNGFGGYKCAPELFYHAPQKLWYLIWQQQDPAYSTTTTPDNPRSWSAPKRFYADGRITNAPNLPIDYWPIADDKNFYLFFTGDDGKVYRSKTTLDQFPNGFGACTVVKSLNTSIIFEGSSHYKVKGTDNTYLHVVEGMGNTGRYFSAWTSEGIEGEWKDYKVGQTNPFARSNTVSYAQGVNDWTDDVSHGELIRENPDQTQELDPCNLKLLYQGKAPNSNDKYELLPYRLGLLTAQQ